MGISTQITPQKMTGGGISTPVVSPSDQASFNIACGGGSPPGTAIIGRELGANDPQTVRAELDKHLQAEVKRNGGKPLDSVIVTDKLMRGRRTYDPALVADVAKKYLKPGGQIGFAQSPKFASAPKDLQAIADKTGLKITTGDSGPSELPSGTVTYQKGKSPVKNPQGQITDGGYGLRGCGTPPTIS